jgi:thiosulfate dehydrogenase
MEMWKTLKWIAVFAVAFAGPATAAGLSDIPNPPTTYPQGELGRMVKLGEDIIMHTDTHPLTKGLVGNKLQCTSCHLQGGRAKTIGTFIGTATAFPAFSKREKTVQTLQDRINNCFMRSMNGKRPIIDTEASVAMASYITWLSEGLPTKLNAKKPVTPYFSASWPDRAAVPLIKKATHANYLHGQKIYQQRCQSCHGGNGQGVGTFPPLWGNASYNTGAGMSKLDKMTSWIEPNMPVGNTNLTRQEAVDVTLYVDAQPRPSFNLQDHLLPKSEMGYYNSHVLKEKHDVRSNFKMFGLDVDAIRGDHDIR